MRDASVLMGLACLVYGAWLAWAPAGPILGGLALATFGILWEIDAQRRGEGRDSHSPKERHVART